MNSAIYVGEVWHRRLAPRVHELRYEVAMPYVELSELDQVLALHPLWSRRAGAPMRWRADDYLPQVAAGVGGRGAGGRGAGGRGAGGRGAGGRGDGEALAERARDRVADLAGWRPDGPVALLANWRSLGWGFNPLALVYCFGAGGALEAVLGEVTNTPWRERSSYLFGTGDGSAHLVAKQMHVSPFCGMRQSYRVMAGAPGAGLAVKVDVEEDGEPVILTELALRRQEMSRASMTSVLLNHPLMAQRVSFGIYRQALALWAKGVPVHRHPRCPVMGAPVAGDACKSLAAGTPAVAVDVGKPPVVGALAQGVRS